MTKHRDVRLRVESLARAALPQAQVIGFDGGSSVPTRIPAGGLVLGVATEPELLGVDLCPPTYHWRYAVAFDLSAPGGAGGAALDTMIEAIRDGIAADPTLGQLVEWTEAVVPVLQDRTEDGVTVNWAETGVAAEYSTSSPLG